MRNLQFSATACRYCQHYTPEGRRGGHCQKLGVPVQAAWKPCPLVIPAFSPSWEDLRRVMDWREQITQPAAVEAEPELAIAPAVSQVELP